MSPEMWSFFRRCPLPLWEPAHLCSVLRLSKNATSWSRILPPLHMNAFLEREIFFLLPRAQRIPEYWLKYRSCLDCWRKGVPVQFLPEISLRCIQQSSPVGSEWWIWLWPIWATTLCVRFLTLLLRCLENSFKHAHLQCHRSHTAVDHG